MTNDKNYHMLLIIIPINEAGKTMQKALGSGWGIIFPGMFVSGLVLLGLPYDAWRVVLVLALLSTALMIYHKRLRHFILLPSCIAVAGVVTLVMMVLQGKSF